MKNYQVAKIANEPRVELKEALNLSGCEVSINELPANASVPHLSMRTSKTRSFTSSLRAMASFLSTAKC